MVLLKAAVLVVENALAALALRPEVTDDNTGVDGEFCAEAAKGCDECDS
jgi:hypothetical protein